VEFYVKAVDTAGQAGYGPLLAPLQNGLYQVDSQVNSTIHEIYRVVLTSADYDWLFARSVNSDELINCTFMAGQDIRYNAGIRFRGNSSRKFPPPKNYRVEFNWTDMPFRGLERLNLNGVNDDPRNQYPDMCIASHEFGHDFLDRANQLTLDHKLISMVTNNLFWPDYIYLSAIDDVFARLKFPGDDGNLYRCITYGGKGADLDYRGTDPNAYRPNYYKHTNESVDDWSDLIELTDVLNNTPDELYARRVSEIVDVEQWMGFFAALNLISYLEGGIHAGLGTEYSMYRRESDGRFVMIPWDMDENFRKTDQPLFPQTLPAVKRFIQHPDHIDLYYGAFRRLLDGPFSVEQMHLATERYRGVLPDEFLDQIEIFVAQRRAYVLARLPQ
jgi:spore coat protein CotH